MKSPLFLSIVFMGMLLRNILFNDFPTIPNGSMETAWSPEMIITPFFQMWELLS
jgi:hypothetical protein